MMRKQNLDFNYNRRPNENERRSIGKRNTIAGSQSAAQGIRKNLEGIRVIYT